MAYPRGPQEITLWYPSSVADPQVQVHRTRASRIDPAGPDTWFFVWFKKEPRMMLERDEAERLVHALRAALDS